MAEYETLRKEYVQDRRVLLNFYPQKGAYVVEWPLGDRLLRTADVYRACGFMEIVSLCDNWEEAWSAAKWFSRECRRLLRADFADNTSYYNAVRLAVFQRMAGRRPVTRSGAYGAKCSEWIAD